MGSEMCIRDSLQVDPGAPGDSQQRGKVPQDTGDVTVPTVTARLYQSFTRRHAGAT